MYKKLALLGVCLLLALAMAHLVAYNRLVVGQGEPDNFLFLPLVRQDYPPPVVNYFQANVTIADPGDTIELSWSTTNAISVTIYYIMPSGQLGTFWDVAATGAMTYTISPSARNRIDFALFAGNAGGQWTGAGAQIILTCPDTWFFSPAPEICPAGPAQFGAGAEQHFEHGLMLWLESQDMIYVLSEDGLSRQWHVYLDEWEEGMPENDPTIIPPTGYFQPERGFGLVWREQTMVRERLGWAIDMESAYDTAVQHTSFSYSNVYIRAADGNVWRLLPLFSGWEKVMVEP
ncbi:MAG: hypothetical protein KJ069_06785 [Anaerolineae bacterium]|nr:hypothetical protein [Anaerolineae bacterium]